MTILDTPDTPQGKRLKDFIRSTRPGQCKLFSVGEACDCLLCDVDNLQRVVAKAKALLVTIAQEDALNGVGDRTVTENYAIRELTDALTPKAETRPELYYGLGG